MKNIYLGIDVGSVSIKAALIDDNNNVVDGIYLINEGNPIQGLKNILKRIKENKNINIIGVGTTGSGRRLIGAIAGAHIMKNEIISHAFSAIEENKDVKTIIDIGGQDSKLIIIRDKIITDFSMNSVCAAGTGSFLEQQSNRLNIDIENFGDIALKADKEVNIAGRCTVFAESDMISLQQMGEKKENIINGLCMSLVKNYLNNLARGKDLCEPILFQGGVAANKGIIAAFKRVLNKKITVPQHYKIMGAIGVALISKLSSNKKTKNGFRGFEIIDRDYISEKFVCKECENNCNIVRVIEGEATLAYWGDRCGKWANKNIMI